MTKATHIAKFAVFLALCVLLTFAGAQSYVEDNYSLQATDGNAPSHPKDGALLAESPGLETWHHDCSNMTSFANQTDNTWALDEGPNEHNVVNGVLESTGSHIYPTDLASGDDWHGPLYYYELEYPATLSEFIELRAAMEIGSTAENKLARLDIILNDQNHAPIMGLSVHDGWAGDDAILPEAYWMFANGSFIRINEGYENSVQTTYNESLRAWQNSTGFFMDLPQVGAFKLVDQDQVDLGRSIRYVSIHAMKWQTNPQCPVMRIHDVVLNWNSSNRVTWLHDCSNITAFNGIGDHTWPRATNLEVTQGTLSSISGYIYASDYGAGTDAYGPLHYHTLGVPFQVSQFLSLEAEIEIDSTAVNRRGEITVSLHDETNKTILSLSVHDRWVGQDDVAAFGAWRFSNYTSRVTPNSHPAFAANQSYRESIRIFRNSTGIYFDAPGIGTFKVVDITYLKPHRVVTYISLHFQGVNDGFGTDICETIRVHNLELTWNNASIVQEPESFIWQDNCTETHNWIYDLDWDGWAPWGISGGTLQTTAGYLHASVDGAVGTGPFWYKALDTPTNLTELYEWNINVQVTQPEESYKGPFAAILYDQNREPMVWFNVYEWDGAAYNLNLYIHYKFENGTYSTHSQFNITDPDWMGTLRISHEWGQGLVATIPGNGTGLILSEADLLTDSHRQISYVGIQWRRGSGDYHIVKLHDISITTTTTGSLVGPSITLSSPSNGTVQPSGALVSFDVSDESGVSHVLASWDSNANGSLSFPYAATLPSGDGQHILRIYSNDTLDIWSAEVYVFVIDDTDPVLDSPNDVSYSEGASGNTISWNPTDIHPLSYYVEQNGTIMKSGAWNSTLETVTISIDGLALEVYNYTVIATDKAGNSISDMVVVTVYDGTAPSIDEPLDIVYEYGTTGHSVTWDPSDLHPEEYQCFLDGTPIESGLWNSSGETIDIGIDSLSIGVYNLTLVVTDIGGNKAVNMVWVTVEDTTVPVVDHPVDIVYSEGLTGNDIIWSPSDSHPFSHQILRNGSTVRSGGWDGSAISIDIDGLTPGVYNYTLVVTDTSGNWQSDEVIVTVLDIDAPIIDHPADLMYSEGHSGYQIIWDPSDSNPSSYQIFRNGTSVKSGTWNSTLETITVSVDGLTLGVYNFTIIVTDGADSTVIDTVFVTVFDGTPPTIDSPIDIFYAEGVAGDSIMWNPLDLHPSSYQILRNQSVVKSGIWNSTGEIISLPVDGLLKGVYNYTIIVVDIEGNQVSDEVMVTVYDAMNPTIIGPSDLEITEGESGQEIVWNPLDLNPYEYVIYLNSTMLRSGSWNVSSDLISVSLDGLSPGYYNFTLWVVDLDENSATDSVFVTVSDETNPVVGSPPDIQVSEGNTDSIVWHPTDANPGSYEILRNGSLIKSGSWNSSSETITVSLEGLLPGVWNYTLVLTDIGGNVVVDTVLVTVRPAATTSSVQPWDASSMIVMIASIGGGGLILIGLVGYFLIVKPRRRRGAAELSETQATPASAAPVESDVVIQALRGGEFVGNRFRFKVKVLNKSPFVITDIAVGLIAYPKDTLRIEGKPVKNIAKLEPNGFRSPTFDFLPTEDCVKGDIIASVSYVDSRGNAHSITTKPFTIRAVCDLLRPESISPEGFMLKLATLGHGEIMSRVEDWTPEEMHEKTLNILRDSNFFEVTSDLSQVGDDHVESKIKGWAKGIYTGNNLGVQVTITGRPGVKGATCKVKMSGEDETMIMPAIDEISKKLGAWLCPRCSGALPVELVNELKAGRSVSCPFCSVTMDR